MERRLAAILAADVVGYSRLMRADEEGTLKRLKALRAELLDPRIAEHNGRIVKTTGDGALVEFASAVDAVRCAVAVQADLVARDDGAPEDSAMTLRIGINVGDIIIEAGDIYGDGVNVAARLEGLAEPGGICLSASVHEQIRHKLGMNFEDLGERSVKNIDQPIRVYRVVLETPVAKSAGPGAERLSLPDKPSIAVLPFDNMSGDPEQEYFSDGITEDIITELSRFGELFVIARNSSFSYKGTSVKVQDIGRDLGVAYIVEGSVRKADNRVRITAQLVDATTGNHLWAEHYDRDLNDIFAVQDDVTQIIVATLTERMKHVGAERAKRKPTAELVAYDYVLRGRELFHKWNSEDNRKARKMFEAAVGLDPNYGVAHGFLAYTHYADWIGGWSKAPHETWERFCALAEQSLALDDAESTPHEVIALAYLYRRRHDEAGIHIEKALGLSPNDADNVMKAGYIAMFDGDHDEAIDRVNQAARLNPFGRYGVALGMALFSAKRYEEAIASLKTTRGKLPHAHAYLAASYAHAGADAEARVAASQLVVVARSEMAKVGASVPENWLEFLAEKFPYRDRADANHLLDGLRKAGVTK